MTDKPMVEHEDEPEVAEFKPESTVYAVATMVPWDSIKVDGNPLLMVGFGNAFMPIFNDEVTARRKFPGHMIIPMGAMKVEEEPTETQEDEESTDG